LALDGGEWSVPSLGNSNPRAHHLVPTGEETEWAPIELTEMFLMKPTVKSDATLTVRFIML